MQPEHHTIRLQLLILFSIFFFLFSACYQFMMFYLLIIRSTDGHEFVLQCLIDINLIKQATADFDRLFCYNDLALTAVLIHCSGFRKID